MTPIYDPGHGTSKAKLYHNEEALYPIITAYLRAMVDGTEQEKDEAGKRWRAAAGIKGDR